MVTPHSLVGSLFVPEQQRVNLLCLSIILDRTWSRHALLPILYVQPHFKRHRKDAVKAEAVCRRLPDDDAPVQLKTFEQQSGIMLHRVQFDAQRKRTQIQTPCGPIRGSSESRRNGIEQLLVVINGNYEAKMGEP